MIELFRCISVLASRLNQQAYGTVDHTAQGVFPLLYNVEILSWSDCHGVTVIE